MKLFHFLFADFWRKLVALVFAVAIYWQAGGFVKKSAPPSASVKVKEDVRISIKEELSRDVEFPVGLIDVGAERRVTFAPGAVPRVKATLCGDDLSGMQPDRELRFYVDAAEFTQGDKALKVRYHIRRPGVRVLSVTPEEIGIVECPVKKP